MKLSISNIIKALLCFVAASVMWVVIAVSLPSPFGFLGGLVIGAILGHCLYNVWPAYVPHEPTQAERDELAKPWEMRIHVKR